MKRRSFIKLITSVIGGSLPLFSSFTNTFKKRRKPYVRVGDQILFLKDEPNSQNGGMFVKEIKVWNGSYYLIEVEDCSSFVKTKPTYEFPDTSLASPEECPEWNLSDNFKKYPNIHTYIRCKRYGETIEQASKISGPRSYRNDIKEFIVYLNDKR